MRRWSWVPFVVMGISPLFGAGAAAGIVWLRLRAGAYDDYPGFMGLSAAGHEFMLLFAFGVVIAPVIGFHVARAILVRHLRQ